MKKSSAGGGGGNIFGSILGAIFGAVGGAGAGAGAGVSAGSGDFRFAASGAHANAGDTFIVGEQGPELFKADKSGPIIPNSILHCTAAILL
jgi:hypothetical protein